MRGGVQIALLQCDYYSLKHKHRSQVNDLVGRFDDNHMRDKIDKR